MFVGSSVRAYLQVALDHAVDGGGGEAVKGVRVQVEVNGEARDEEQQHAPHRNLLVTCRHPPRGPPLYNT